MDPSTASSSTASHFINSGYDVFINHRGLDTKKTFASYLYRRLHLHGFTAFLDQEELQEGDHFPSQIERSIQNASVHVAIFSETYADSPWCLHELLKMLESRKPIVPIFYNVEPAALKWTGQKKEGVYAKALNKLQGKKTLDSQTNEEKPRYDPATIRKWRDALSTVAEKSGFDLKGKFNRDEGLMLDKVMERVMEIMAKKTRLHVAKYPTGLDNKVKDIETTVLRKQHTQKGQVVGIVGLGGVGKTTVAIELFNRMRSKYSVSYFLSEVRENAKSSLHSLQSKLLKGLGQWDRHIDDIHQGTQRLIQVLSFDKVLLVLDDIDHQDQIDALLPDRDVLHKDSLILVTSRDKAVLARSRVEEASIYKLTGLTKQHSRQLFCSYAFCHPHPLPGYEDLVDKFLLVCDGLPLSLKVFGALLCGMNDKSLCEGILHQVKVPTDILNRLKISYDALNEEERQFFLDIACLFVGEKKSSVITVCDSKGLLGFKNLEAKCLVEVDHENVIHMHEHLQDMGRDIAEKELPSRLWRYPENIHDWLHQQSSVITEARGIRLFPERHNTEGGGTGSQMLSWYEWTHKLLENCGLKRRDRLHSENLQFLQTEGYLLECILRRVSPPNLRWLSWRDCPYSYLPSWIPVKNLRVLKVQGGVLTTLWPSKSQVPLQLQELEIIDVEHLSNIPPWIGEMKSLRALVLRGCSIKALPNSFSNLTNLHHMDLYRCHRLKTLPDSFGNLRNLRHIDLSLCRNLKTLPDSFGGLMNLHRMDLRGCKNLESLPDFFGSLRNLHSVDLSGCEKLESLPDCFGNLMNLYRMDLSGCSNLKRLLGSFGSLRKLHHLDLSLCPTLKTLPNTFGRLMNLHSLNLSWCKGLKRLPDSFGDLTNLHSMNLTGCWNLRSLPDSIGRLTNLHRMDIHECIHLHTLPDSFNSLTKLHQINLSEVPLKRLPDSFGCLSNLHHMDMSITKDYKLLVELPYTFGSLTNLHQLNLSGNRLTSLPDSFDSMRNLHHLNLSMCTDLRSLPDSFGSLTNLHNLKLLGCNKLRRLPDTLGSCTNLRYMNLSNCCNLDRLSDSFGSLSSIEFLDASGCYFLTISSYTLGNIRTLVHIDLSDCEKIEVWPSQLAHQSSLKVLKLTGTNFKELPSATEVPSDLEVLWIENPLLDTLLPSLGELRNLRELTLQDYKELKRLSLIEQQPQALCSLSKLQTLEFRNCKELKSIRDLAQLTKLESLKVHGCLELEELEGVEYCMSLKMLDVYNCPKLQWGEGVVDRLKSRISRIFLREMSSSDPSQLNSDSCDENMYKDMEELNSDSCDEDMYKDLEELNSGSCDD